MGKDGHGALAGDGVDYFSKCGLWMRVRLKKSLSGVGAKVGHRTLASEGLCHVVFILMIKLVIRVGGIAVRVDAGPR